MNDTFLNAVLNVCEIHKSRIELALSKIKHCFPMTSDTYENFTAEELGFLEILTSRFAKLQDQIGVKLFDLLLEETQQKVGLSLRDKIHQLEKLGLDINDEDWFQLRTIRNHATHEYPDNPEILARHMNALYEKIDLLFSIYNSLKNYALKQQSVHG